MYVVLQMIANIVILREFFFFYYTDLGVTTEIIPLIYNSSPILAVIVANTWLSLPILLPVVCVL